MIKAVANTKAYFCAPKNYFWRWADAGQVIEFREGMTICYREDFISILRELSEEGLPSPGPVLMILHASREPMGFQHEFLVKYNRGDDGYMGKLAEDTLLFLRMINSLPPELKNGKPRVHLVREVLGKSGYVYDRLQARETIDELNSGRQDAVIFQEGPEITPRQVIADLWCFSQALARYPNQQALELRLRTGLRELPQPAKDIIPEVALGILDQLASDPDTAGISRLAKRLVAALNIPMHSSESGDQSYGGITDITNRGNYDKLLLSELAHDNDLLMARLVNNEALYFRREEPPDNPKRQRTVLVDTTLKMWGVPRVFAISAALAFSQNTRHEEVVEAYALAGEAFTEIDLETKEGIVKSLELLDHSLHCGKALEKAIDEIPATGYNDFIFITDEVSLNNPTFHAHLAKVREALGFILTLNRNGETWFYECKKGRTKLLSKAKLDLGESLFAPVRVPRKQQHARPAPRDIQLAFLEQTPPPLLFPKVRIKIAEGKVFSAGPGVVLVNENQRVLYVPHKGSAGFELLDYIEKGTYSFGFDPPHNYFLTVNNFQRKFFKLYHMKLDSGTHTSINLSDEIQFARDVFFHDNKFYIRTPYASFILNCESATVTDKQGYEAWPEMIPRELSVDEQQKNLQMMAEIIHPHDSAMYNVKQLFISEEGKLVIGNYTLLTFWQPDEFVIRVNETTVGSRGTHFSAEISVNRTVFRNKNIRFITRRWNDGSEAIIDTRGFLHLKSADPAIPQISLVLVTGCLTACWSSDGIACGSNYFINRQRVNRIPVEEFYEKYIQRFIDHIRRLS